MSNRWKQLHILFDTREGDLAQQGRLENFFG